MNSYNLRSRPCFSSSRCKGKSKDVAATSSRVCCLLGCLSHYASSCSLSSIRSALASTKAIPHYRVTTPKL
eukprot:3016327-Amphidinium_carterae.1